MKKKTRNAVKPTARSATGTVSTAINPLEHSLKACVDCGHKTTELLHEIGSVATTTTTDTAAEWLKLAKDAVVCSSYKDMVNLQARALSLGVETCLNTTGKICNLAFDGSKKALAPLAQQFMQVPNPKTPWMLGM